MRTSGLPNFEKLWGVIDSKIEKGKYILKVTNNYDSSKWEGKRHFILTSNSNLGGKKVSMGTILMGVSVICFIACGFFFRKWKKNS